MTEGKAILQLYTAAQPLLPTSTKRAMSINERLVSVDDTDPSIGWEGQWSSVRGNTDDWGNHGLPFLGTLRRTTNGSLSFSFRGTRTSYHPNPCPTLTVTPNSQERVCQRGVPSDRASVRAQQGKETPSCMIQIGNASSTERVAGNKSTTRRSLGATSSYAPAEIFLVAIILSN